MDASGSNPNPEKGRPSSSRFPSDAAGPKIRQILVIEDNKADVYLIRQAIKASEVECTVHVVTDGFAATQFFDATDSDGTAPSPDLVLLDLNLPKVSGDDVLKHLRNSKRCCEARVVVVTSSESRRDREAVAGFAVAAYFRKPSEYAEFMKLGGVVRSVLGVE